MLKIYHHLSFISAILAALGYLVFTIMAYFLYPLHYSPVSNWLSDLGNPVINTRGAILYNIGIILTGCLVAVFFVGLSVWVSNNKIQVIMLRLTQVFGIIGSICMIMSALFPINLYKIHSAWSSSLYILLSTSFIFSAAMLRYHPRVPRWLLVLGILTAVIVILTGFLPTVYVLEWIAVFLFLCYVTLLGIMTERMQIWLVGVHQP